MVRVLQTERTVATAYTGELDSIVFSRSGAIAWAIGFMPAWFLDQESY